MNLTVDENDTIVFPLVRAQTPAGAVAVREQRRRRRADAVLELDDASLVLPPSGEGAAGPTGLDGSGVPLWHTASFAAVARTPTPRSKVAVAAAALLAGLVVLGGYAGFQAASVGGLLPPSPPRHVVADAGWMKRILMPDGVNAAEGSRPPTAPVRPPVRGDERPKRPAGGGPVATPYMLRSH